MIGRLLDRVLWWRRPFTWLPPPLSMRWIQDHSYNAGKARRHE